MLITMSGMPVLSQQNLQKENEFETDATSLQTLTGLIASQRFGYSIENNVDLNSDGYDDIVVSAHLTNSSAGRVYIYFGGQNISSVPSLVLNGEAANNFFGISISTAGDVNGDGYEDIIVGAYGYSSGIGRAYIYFGGYNMDNIPDVVLTGPGAVSFGYSVSSAGDLNGDGFSDVIVSGHAYSANRGRAYIYYGGLIMDNVIDKTLEGTVNGGNFGFSLSGAGDVNGDGYSDVIVGAYSVSSFTGHSYLFYGGANMDTVADVSYTGETVNSLFGQQVSDAGDVNGDGYSDIYIGAPSYSATTGRGYIYYGGSAPDNTADVVFTGEVTGINFGRGAACAGDVNGDGYDDFLIGAQGYQSLRGRAYLYYGGSAMNNVPDMIFTGETPSSILGFSVAGGGDINGDGYKDFIVGASGFNSNRGKIYIYKNSLTGNDLPDVITYGEYQSQLGISISDAGDLNGDGYDDYIVGAPSYGDFARGRVYIHFGSANPDTIPDLIINGFADQSWFGWSVAGVGDVNADGYDDIAVGAPEHNSQQGRVYVYFGGSIMDTVHDLRMSGITTSSRFGHSISSAGDMNGDGYSDILIGAPSYASSRGRFQVYYGGSPMDTVSDYGITGSAVNNYLGSSVSDAGDLNGDGYSDILAGAPGYDTTGGVYTVLGNSLSLRVVKGENNNDGFGAGVSGAGDVNGDGYSDFIVGAPYANSHGKTYLYFGGLDLDYNHDVEYFGFYSEFGNSVSSAGDVNNDGFEDVLIGEKSFDINKGRSYIYFGGYTPDNSYDIVMSINNWGEEFGYSVSNAGDINGDGIEDILIGGPGNEIYGGASGAAYLYLSNPPSVKPILISVKDVPNDQGGKVNLKWTRSAYDVVGTDMITDYLIQRSLPPGSGGFYWENIAYIPATRESFYAYNDNTPFDSLSGNNGTLYYRVTARTNNQNNFWRSNIVFGRSIDNLAPPVVSPFTAVSSGSNVLLNWKRSTAPDLLNYILFRSVSPVIDPQTETPFAALTDSAFLDTSPLQGLYYYFIVAQDIHNNLSPVAVASAPNISLNLTMFIEGFYDAGSDSQVIDTIKVYLRNIISPFAKVDSAKAVVSADGNAALLFGNASSGQYYITIAHRSSIETWSKSGGENLTIGSAVNFNFSNALSQAFGNNMRQIDSSPLRYGVYSGDVNQDGIIDLNDVLLTYNAANTFAAGHVVTDINGDSIVDLNDILIAYNNASGFIGVVKP